MFLVHFANSSYLPGQNPTMSPTLQASFTLGYNSFSQTLVYRGNYAMVGTANFCSICTSDKGVFGRR